jgi:hypothetical protein
MNDALFIEYGREPVAQKNLRRVYVCNFLVKVGSAITSRDQTEKWKYDEEAQCALQTNQAV